MATSGSFYTNIYETSDSPNRYLFSWELVSQSIIDNTSTISWSLKGAGGSSDGRWVYVKEKYCTVDGSTKSNSTLQLTYNGTVAFSGTTVIKHNGDGKKSFSASAGGAFFYYGSYNSTGSGSWELPTIARATTPKVSSTSVNMGSSITIQLRPANSTFKHKLRYNFVSIVGSANGMSVGANFTAAGNVDVTFTPPTSLGDLIPNSTHAYCAIDCYTYSSDGTHIGTTQIGINVYAPTYNVPTPRLSVVGNKLLNGAYVQNKSTATISITASSLYGASIKSYSATIDGKTYTGPKFTTSAFATSGSKSISVTVTDTRGKTATFTSTSSTTPANITVYAYSNPYITEFTLVRDADTPTTVIATVKGNISAINNKNSRTITVTLNGLTQAITSSAYTINGTTTFTNVSTDSSFVGVATFKDSYMSVSKDYQLTTVDVTMDFYKDGNGVAFGKVAEEGDLLDIDWDVKIKGNYLNDFAFYRGISDGWIVKKYISGDIEAYKSVSVNTTVSTTYGGGFYNGSTLSVNLPTDFLNNAFPIININAQSTQAQILDASIASYNQAERKISYYITSPGKQATSYQVWVHFRVAGKWK